MSVGTLMGLCTALFVVVFLGIVVWAYSSRRRKDFDEASRMPLDDNNDDKGDDSQKKDRRS